MRSTYTTRTRARRLARDARGWLAAVALSAPLAACDQLDRALSVETPSRLPADVLTQPESAELLVNGAEADFECALGAYIVVGGLISGELADATQTAARWSYDRRVIDPAESRYSLSACEDIGVYTPLSTARFTSDQALTRLEGWTDEEVENRQGLMARAADYAGYSLLLLGEGFCSAATDEGPELSQQELFALAEERFTRAIAAATAAEETDLLNLAYVGRARARLNQGNGAGADADAALVPPDFEYTLETFTTPNRLNNRVFVENTQTAAVSVGESYRNLNDPRVAVGTDPGRPLAQDRLTPFFIQEKYDSRTAPYIVASGREAALIRAEVAGGVTPQLVEDRRRTLFLEGQRLFDIQRFAAVDPALVPLTPAPGTPYPKGGSYGDLAGQRCMPLPDVERLNNPNIPDA
jgi:starch-binding outer membrane protein, SusD/RagB family